MATLDEIFRVKKIRIKNVLENKSTGQWTIHLPKKKLKKYNLPPRMVEVNCYWDK